MTLHMVPGREFKAPARRADPMRQFVRIGSDDVPRAKEGLLRMGELTRPPMRAPSSPRNPVPRIQP